MPVEDNKQGKTDILQESKHAENDDVVLRKPSQSEFNVTITEDSPVMNGKIESAEIAPVLTEYTKNVTIYDDTGSFDDFLDNILQGYDENRENNTENLPDINMPEPLFSKEYNSKDYNDRTDLIGIDLADLKTFYKNNGNSSQKTYQYLKDYINENKDNPKILNTTISRLLEDFNKLYDDKTPHKKVGENQPEVLDKIINTPDGEQLSGFICGPIHSFIMNTLDECGIKSALLSGGNVEGGNHLTLLYQQSDGKYVFNNYGKNIVINAANIKDAAREVFKRSHSLESTGYIMFQDDGEKSYQEFALEKEAVFGDEMDKRDYHLETPFDLPINPAPAVKGSFEISTNGNLSAEAGGSLVYGNSVKDTETSITLGFKKNNETSMFLNSESVGLKLEHKGINHDSGIFYDTKGITSYTAGELGGCEYIQDDTGNLNALSKMTEDIRNDLTSAGFDNETINAMAPVVDNTPENAIFKHTPAFQKTKYLSTFFKGSVGKKSTLLKTENMELSNSAKTTVCAGTTFELAGSGVRGDARILAEDGFELKNRIQDVTLKNSVSGGVLTDLKFTNTGMCFGLQPGVKLNASSSVNCNPNKNMCINAGVNAGAVVTAVDKDFGVDGNVSVVFKPSNSNVLLYGDANVGLYRQRITIGGFNEQTENKTHFSVGLGAQLNPKTSVSVRYNNERDALNKTRNNSSVTIGTKITF